jgi:transcriptional regulator with XRE-family HTH domain
MTGIGENIRILRELRGLSQKELAEASGITTAVLSRLERGGQFSTNKLAEIAKALNARVSDIDPVLKEDLARLEGHLASVPQRLRQARERAGYSAATVASEALGVAYGTYSSHENGLRGIKGQDLARYALFFKVTPDWLQFGRGTIDDYVEGAERQPNQDAAEEDRRLRAGAKLSDRIKTIRGARSLVQFGQEVGASPQVVNHWESGATVPSLQVLQKISQEFEAGLLPRQDAGAACLNDELIATLDGVLDGYGVSAKRRKKLVEAFVNTLNEDIKLKANQDRAMARRAIARAVVRALNLSAE